MSPGLAAIVLLASVAATRPTNPTTLHAATDDQDDEEVRVTTEDEAPLRSIALVGHVGLDAPLGIVAASVAWMPLRWVTVDLGGGLDRDGVQVGVMPRLFALPRPDLALGVGFGVSAGPWSYGRRAWITNDVCYPCSVTVTRQWQRAVFANMELVVETRPAKNGVFVGAHAGIGRVLNPGEGTCEPRSPLCSGLDGAVRTYVAVSVGRLFSL